MDTELSHAFHVFLSMTAIPPRTPRETARIYLDANASEPLRPEAEAAWLDASRLAGNPASVHGAGRAARDALETARETLALLFGARPAGVVFVSGGTEANVLALRGLGAGRHGLMGATEHDAVRDAMPDAQTLMVAPDGEVDLEELDSALSRHGKSVVALMLANNETGVLHPIAEAAKLCRARGAWLHVDAVQAAGRLAVNLADTGAHSLALASHKLGGPHGAGALLLDPEAEAALSPIWRGGGQERGRRGGTPPVAAIAGFAAAARAAIGARDTEQAKLGALRDRIEAAAVAVGARVAGAGAPRLANTSCLVLPGHAALTQVMALDLAGYAVSAGAACSSGKVAPSAVLRAMGYDAAAAEAIRVSLPWNVSPPDADGFIAAYQALAASQAHAS